jgi:drug/metabolite transporter (DMT)-like permease
VPVLAILGGAALLGEAITAQILMASALVLGGIGLSVLGRSQRRMGSSGS